MNTKNKIMSHIFYFFGLFAIMFEAVVIAKPFRYHEFVKEFKATKSDEYDSSQRTYMFFMFGYFFWAFLGLMTDQWICFAALIFISLIPLKGLGGYGKLVDALITFLIVSFTVLNHFHFNISTTEMVLSLFK